MIDATLACEDANSKLVKVVAVSDVSDKDRVGKSLLQIWKPRFGHNPQATFVQTLSTFVKILKLKFAEILKLKLGQYFAADVWLRLRS